MPRNRDPSPMSGVEEPYKGPPKPKEHNSPMSGIKKWDDQSFFRHKGEFVAEPTGYSLPCSKESDAKPPAWRDSKPMYSEETDENDRPSSPSSESDYNLDRPKRLRTPCGPGSQSDSSKPAGKKLKYSTGGDKDDSIGYADSERDEDRVRKCLDKLSIKETPKKDKTRTNEIPKTAKAHRQSPPAGSSKPAKAAKTLVEPTQSKNSNIKHKILPKANPPTPAAELSKPGKTANPPIIPTEGESLKKPSKLILEDSEDSQAPKKKPKDRGKKPGDRKKLRKPKGDGSGKTGKEKERVGEVDKKT